MTQTTRPHTPPATSAIALSSDAEPIYRERLLERRREANGIFLWLLPAQWLFALLLAFTVSPRAWAGLSSTVHPHVWAALLGGGLIVSAPLAFIRWRPQDKITGHVVAVAQMLFSALLIHLTGGRLETHFHVFGSIAILAFYLDRSVLLTATAVVVADHLLRGLFYPESVYGVSTAGWWRSLEHGGWVLFEVLFLVYFAHRTFRRTLRLAAESAASQQALKESEQRFRLVIETAYDAYVAMDADGRIAGWNEQAVKTFGWTSAEVMGHSLAERIIPERFREAHHQGMQRFLHSGEGKALNQRLELFALHRDGSEFPVEMTISAVRCGESYLFNAFLRDITERREAARQREDMHRQLLETSRQAGKAEVAVGVLHNVGNVLNSVNVSAGMIHDTVRNSKIGALGEVVELLRSQNGGLAEFLTNDPRGRLIPDLLGRLTDSLRAEQTRLTSEASALVSHVGHIRETVSLQQSHGSVSGVAEKLMAAQLIEDALKLEGSAMVRHGIDVQRELDPVPPMIGDRHKTLQILVNLLRNAKQAMATNGARGKQLTLQVRHEEGGPVRMIVRDNGTGIPPENLSRIFNHGFTTKPSGHGFGLHISALAAREMGGTLTAESDGAEQGASFTLELPLAPVEASRTANSGAVALSSLTPPVSPTPVLTANEP